tara:strand:+ start:2298 stop:3005 length:708 start_codon:yes stop_codon:yes gene_type:complete
MKIMKNEKKRVIETYCKSPHISMKELAINSNIAYPTLMKWMHDPVFIDQIYKRYMEVAGIELPNVISAMIREAKTGNVQAGRLVLEHFGKLENKIKIQVESPFEKFVKAKEIQAEEAEYIEEDDTEMDSDNRDFINKLYVESEDTISTLPKRDTESKTKREAREKQQIEYQTQKEIKKARYSSNSQTRYQLRKRAKAVGLPLMTTSGRPLKSEREEWLRELERLEIERFGEIQNL